MGPSSASMSSTTKGRPERRPTARTSRGSRPGSASRRSSVSPLTASMSMTSSTVNPIVLRAAPTCSSTVVPPLPPPPPAPPPPPPPAPPFPAAVRRGGLPQGLPPLHHRDQGPAHVDEPRHHRRRPRDPGRRQARQDFPDGVR